MSESDAESVPLPIQPPLSAEEARVLGCLIEKAGTTPENYPLTLNATVSACNQKTNREPVMKLEPGRVGQALRSLERRGLVTSEYGARAERHAHALDEGLGVTAAQRVLLGLLLLRGPQTVAELHTRSGRLHRFEDPDEVRFQLERLAVHDAPRVVRIPRGPGRREDRYMHRLAGPVDITAATAVPGPAGGEASMAGLLDRIEALEARVQALEEDRRA